MTHAMEIEIEQACPSDYPGEIAGDTRGIKRPVARVTEDQVGFLYGLCSIPPLACSAWRRSRSRWISEADMSILLRL